MGELKYRNIWLGAILALIGAILGIGLNSLFFINNYQLYISEQLAQFPGLTNWKVITYLLPVFSDFSILAGVLYLISLYGFVGKKNWAYNIAVVANVLALQFSFWPMIPAMDMGLTPVYALVFLPNAIIYLVLHRGVGDKSWGKVIFGLITGMLFVTGYINGTASLNMWWMQGKSLFMLANRMHWVVALTFGIITVGIMVAPQKEWLKPLGFGMAILEIALGTPMGIQTTIVKGEFSMYLAAPILSVIFLVVSLTPLWKKIVLADLEVATE